MRVTDINDIHCSTLMPIGHTAGRGDMLSAEFRVNLTVKESNDLLDAMERSRKNRRPIEIEVKFK